MIGSQRYKTRKKYQLKMIYSNLLKTLSLGGAVRVQAIEDGQGNWRFKRLRSQRTRRRAEHMGHMQMELRIDEVIVSALS